MKKQKPQYAFQVKRKAFEKVCEQAGIHSQVELAHHLGVRPATVNQILNGRSSPSPQFIGLVINKFPGTSVESLFEVRRKAALDPRRKEAV